ncbi:MAG: hypothetical protein P9M15_07525 [Candidatus Electryoneaceae bacterium]|nr:hypothetical protein [Candidatus Electryoneaceae bacterium]
MEFLQEASTKSQAYLEGQTNTAFHENDASLCIAIPKGKRLQACAELPVVVLSMLFLLVSICTLPLALLGHIPFRIVVPVLLIGLCGSLIFRKIQYLTLRSALSSREGNLLKALPNLPRLSVNVEDGTTVKKVKILTEDQGVCLLDARNRRILLEGCCFRTIIHAQDVESVRPVSGYSLSAASIFCTIAGEPVEISLAIAGQGPMQSMIQAFAPGKGAKDLTVQITETLFGLSTRVSYERPQPPPLPDKQHAEAEARTLTPDP